MKTIDPFTRRKLKANEKSWTPEEALQAALADVQSMLDSKTPVTQVIVLTIRDSENDSTKETVKDYTSQMSNSTYFWYLETAKIKMLTEE